MNIPIPLNHEGIDELEHAKLLSFAHDSYAQNVYQNDEITKLQAQLDAAKASIDELKESLAYTIKAADGWYDDSHGGDLETHGMFTAKRLLVKTPEQSLAAIQANAILDFLVGQAPRLPPFENMEEATEKYHCELTLYLERERLHNQASKLNKDNMDSNETI